MTRQLEATPTTVDRRSLIRKAAVGGAVAWTTPTLLSSNVLAAGAVCTAKCGGEAIPANFETFINCPSGGQKWLGISFDLIPDCPCEGSSGRLFSTPVFSNLKSDNTTLVVFGLVTVVGNRVTATFKKATGNGAVGDSTVSGTITYSVGCTDRDGDEVVQQCSGNFSFGWNPGNGNCGDEVNLATPKYTPLGCVSLGCP